jgi:hypothetical protein
MEAFRVCCKHKCPYCNYDFIVKTYFCTFDFDYFGYCYLTKKEVQDEKGG